MKNSTIGELTRSFDTTLVFKPLTASDFETLLMPFYLGLDFDARRNRFGGAMSDEAIRRHCRRLDPKTAIILACSSSAGLIAAIELHSLLSDWEDSELAIADCAKADQKTIIAHLLQLAAFAAGKRGCTSFVVPSFSSEREFLELLRGMGRVRVEADALRVEIGEYASLQLHAESPM